MKRIQRRPWRPGCFVALILVVLGSPAAPAATAEDAVSAEEAWALLLRSPLERDGDLDGLAAAWIDLVSRQSKHPEVPSSPPAELVLRRLRSVLSDLASPGVVEHSLRELVASGLLDSTAHDVAVELLATFYRRLGDNAAEEELDPDRGFLVNWLLVGPFGTGARSELLRRFAPESRLDLEAKYDGAVEWTQLKRQKPGRFISALNAFGNAPGVYYHLSQVRRDGSGELRLEIRSIEPVWIFLNGDLMVAESDDEFRGNPRHYEPAFVSGWNHVLVKSRGKALAVRLLDDGGRAVARDKYEEEARQTLNSVVVALESPSAPERSLLSPSWRSSLNVEADAPATPTTTVSLRADMLAGRALLEASTARPDLAVRFIEEAIAAAPESAALHYHAGRIVERATHMPREFSRRRSRSLYEKAKSLDDDFLPARLALARFLYSDDQIKSSLEELANIIERNPRYLASLLLLLGVYEERGWESEALETAGLIDAISTATTDAPVFRARLAKRQGNLEDATTHYATAYARDKTRAGLLRELASLELRRGNAKVARGHLEAWRALRPDSAGATFALARFLLDVGESDAGIALLRDRAERFPADPRGFRRLGEELERLGRKDAARKAYETSLALSRGDARLHRRLKAFRSDNSGQSEEGEPFDRFWEAFDERLEDWIQQIPDASRFPKAGSVAVLDIAVAKVFPDGAVSEFTHQALLLLNDASKEELAKVSIPGELDLLRTVTPEGAVLEPIAAEGRSQYVMPGLEPGAIVEFSYHRESTSRDWLLKQGPFFFQDYRYRQPMLLTRFVVIVPPDLPADVVERGFKRHNDPRFATVERREHELEGGWRAIVYEAKNVPRLEPEEPRGVMPSREDYLPNVALVERKDIADVAAQLRDTVLGKTRVSPELEAFARESVADLKDPTEKAKALFARVNERIPNDRGSGDALGVFLESSGDRTLLYKSLLDAAGIPNSWAFARMRSGIAPRADFGHPEPALFSKPLLLVEPEPDTSYWITLDARHAPFGKLPYYYEGGQALVLRSTDTEILPIPDQTEGVAWTDSLRGTIRLGVAEDDPLAVSSSITISSRHYSSYEQKALVENLDKFRQQVVISRLANSLFPGAQMKEFDIPGAKDLGKPLVFRIDILAPKFLQKVDDGYLMRAIVNPVEMVRRYCRIPARTHPYHLRSESIRFDRVRVEPGERFQITKIPESRVLASPLGTYGLRFYKDDDALVVERRLNLLPGTLSVDEFPQFLEFCQRVDEAEEQRVVLGGRE